MKNAIDLALSGGPVHKASKICGIASAILKHRLENDDPKKSRPMTYCQIAKKNEIVKHCPIESFFFVFVVFISNSRYSSL